jgi:hypothetical protein
MVLLFDRNGLEALNELVRIKLLLSANIVSLMNNGLRATPKIVAFKEVLARTSGLKPSDIRDASWFHAQCQRLWMR